MNNNNKLIKSILLIVLVLAIGSYILRTTPRNYRPLTDSELKILMDNPEDVLEVKGQVAVFFSPDETEIEEMKKEFGEENFYIVAEDMIHYELTAVEFLKEKHITIVATDKRYIKFTGTGADAGYEIVLDRKALAPKSFGVFLFDGKSQPFLASTVDIDIDYAKYFK